MDNLWAPWRLAYVENPKPRTGKESPQQCFICQALSADPMQDEENFVVKRGTLSSVILNRFPYNNGHLLVVPNRHLASLEMLNAEELLDLQNQIVEMMASLKRIMNPDGFNIGLNLGAAAGAGLPGHLHWHIVPRWHGDCNFMPVISDTRVVPQSLQALWQLLKRDAARSRLDVHS